MANKSQFTYNGDFILKLRAIEANTEHLESLIKAGSISDEEEKIYRKVLKLQFTKLISSYYKDNRNTG